VGVRNRTGSSEIATLPSKEQEWEEAEKGWVKPIHDEKLLDNNGDWCNDFSRRAIAA